jgi:pimeloyl-ACP methyl ester carboxylesterase
MPEERPDAEFEYVMCVRKIKNGEFIAEPGRTRYLKVPAGKPLDPDQEIRARQWFDEVGPLADGMARNKIDPAGDVLVFIHGYNNSQSIVMKRHRQLQADLWNEGFRGLVVSFDWPSADMTVNYLEDRWDASETAIRLVTDTIRPLAARQSNGCATNVHLLGHSTGAYVIREAFYHARKKGELHRSDWKVSQVALIGGDIARATLDENDSVTRPLYERMLRLTNYSNRFDKVLKVSNAKRLGLRSRVGRVGLPKNHHPKCVNVDCSDYFKDLDPDAYPVFGTFCHSWHIGNPVFARDLALTLHGGIDRQALPTRKRDQGELHLIDADIPQATEDRWLDHFNSEFG